MPSPKAPDADIYGSCSADGPASEDIGPGECHSEKPCADDDQGTEQLEARKLVKTMAKRALRDLMAFLSQFDYSPDLPVVVNKEFMERVYTASHSARVPRWSDVNRAADRHMVYPLSELFSGVPPANLPTYPNQEVARRGDSMSVRPCKTCEWVTYHPLLTEALHSLLLAHCLAQTSAKELQRHAYMVARLVRLCDGHPVFQASRSPARTDWVEVNRRAKNWLSLCGSWDSLCFPAPLPVCDSTTPLPASSAPNPARATAAAALINGGSAMGQATVKASRTEQSPAESMDRQVAPGSGATSSKAPEAAGMRKTSTRSDTNLPIFNSANIKSTAWGAGEDGKEHTMATDRSACITLWVTEAPLVTGTRRRKRVKRGASVRADSTANELAKLDLEEVDAAA